MKSALGKDILIKFRTAFKADSRNLLAQNVCTKMDPFEVALSRKKIEETQHVYNHKIENEGKPITNQKSSGRCWIFAALNIMRIPFAKHLNVEDFEFSQGYLFFWDKIERCNFFLNNIVETARRNEPIDGRLVSFLLLDPTCDGGQWDMIVNLINKYGVVPKKCFPDSYGCESSGRMNIILKSKLREFSKVLRDLVSKESSDEDIQTTIESQMNVIFRIIGICIGIPDETFTWSYYDKNKVYHSIGPITPIQFYEEHVKQIFNVDDKVCLVTDPRPTNQYGKAYSLDCLGNIVGGRRCIYNNQPVDLLIKLAAESIKHNEPVWFGCDVSKRFAGKLGIQDLTIQDFSLIFGTDIQIELSKADRLMYGESAMTHAMVFTAVSVNENNDVTKFRVENSWGEERGEKGYLLMTTDWFKEFVFEVVVDKKHVPESVLEVFKQEPIVLPAWDPMGTLAN